MNTTYSPAITIKPCTVRDCETMAMIHAIVLPSGWSADEFQNLLRGQGVTGYLALTKEGHACGILLIRSVADECEILTLGVLYEMQRNGIASGLLTQACEVERQRGIHLVHLEVQEDNSDALAFYAKMGFLPTGRRKDYYTTRDGYKDAILMSRTIIGPFNSHTESSF